MAPLHEELRQAHTASACVVSYAHAPIALQVGVPNQTAAQLLQAHGGNSGE